MRSVILRSLAVIGAGALVLAGVLYVASTIDARPPEVLEIKLTQALPDDSRRALITTSLEVVFSEPVDPESAHDALYLDPAVAGAVSWSGSTMIFTPSDPLELETEYSVRVDGRIRDASGNEMAELPPQFVFETAGRPSLVDATPPDGATGVPLDEPIALTFSTLMDTASVAAELRLRPAFAHELRWSGELLEIVPTQPLRAGLEYEVSVRADAADVAGVTLGGPISLRFRTAAPGLAIDLLVPADGLDGIATTSPIAVIFDRPIDAESVSDDLLSIAPEVAGTLSAAGPSGEPAGDGGPATMLLFTPSGPLPANTTFDVELLSGVSSTAGGVLGGPASWTFTTGAPVTGISNQVTLISDRAGVANVWAMNPDGTGKHQLSAELTPILDYAVSPDGSSLVLADGRRLIHQRPDGSQRRVLTEEGQVEFDPAYAPNGERIAFARADAETGVGLGLWEWEVGGAEATRIVLPPEPGDDPAPTASGADDGSSLRAPRYSPDGEALAFVDLAGWVGVLELPSERLTRVPVDGAAVPLWLAGSTSLLVTGTPVDEPLPPTRFEAPVAPLTPDGDDEVFRLARAGTTLRETVFGIGARALAVAANGEIAYLDHRGSLWLTDAATSAGEVAIRGERIIAATFAPGERAMVIVSGDEGEQGRVDLLDLDTGRRTQLALRGSRPRWLP